MATKRECDRCGAGHTCMSTTALVMGAGGGEFRCKLKNFLLLQGFPPLLCIFFLTFVRAYVNVIVRAKVR